MVSKNQKQEILENMNYSRQKFQAEAKSLNISTAEYYHLQSLKLKELKKQSAHERKMQLQRERRSLKRTVDIDELSKIINSYKFVNTRELILKNMNYTPKQFQLEARSLGITVKEYYEIQEQALNEINQVNDNKPFKLTMKSWLNPDIQIEKHFKSTTQYNRWVKTFKENENDYKDSSNINIKKSDHVFDRFTYKIDEIKGGANVRAESRVYKGSYYNITIKQKRVRYNNCGPDCLIDLFGLDMTANQIRKIINKPIEELFSISDMYQVAKHFNKKIIIHTIATDNIEDGNNILFNNNHYSVISEYELRNKDPEGKIKCGILFWDIETRATEQYCMVGSNRSYYIKDTILCAYYKPYKATEFIKLNFTTNDIKSSCRQFLDWLIQESRDNRHYMCYAHNGGNFDTYFLIMNFNKDEAGQYTPSLRGSTIIDLRFAGHSFKDTRCYLTKSLEDLSTDFKVEVPKLTSFNYKGNELTNLQMCFYKPEITFKEYLQLEQTEPEFWKLYCQYCMVDCIALSQIWEKFEQSHITLIEKFCEMAPYAKNNLLQNCKLRQSCTIGGIALKILEALNKNQYAYKYYLKFLQGDDGKVDTKKHNFIMNNFKRGGISHCNQKGKHTEGVMSVDICSQYPASMMYMKIAAGVSDWTKIYNPDKFGYYILTNLVFESELSFKPVCEVLQSKVLNWTTNKTIDRLPLDSYMIKYLQKNYGLISFDVEDALVSDNEIDGSKLFGKYVNVLFEQKAIQDVLKNNKDPLYNPSYRDTIKLFLNAVTGKLVMDKRKYNSLKFTEETEGEIKSINGIDYVVEENDNPFNTWVNAGVMVYSYSKRLLFEYIDMLPQRSTDVIHVETDSIYFPKSCEQSLIKSLENYTGDFNCAFGNELGNIKIEKKTDDVCYFLGKKTYYIAGNCIYKGIPPKTTMVDGTRIENLNVGVYDKVYQHKINDIPITIKYNTMVRSLFGKTKISQHWQTRTLNSTYDYKLF